MTPGMKYNQDLVLSLHEVYQRISGLSVPLTLGRIYQWELFLTQGHTKEDLVLTLGHLKRRLLKHEVSLGRMRFSTLIGNLDNFSEDLAEARAVARVPVVDRGRLEMLKATGRDAAPQTGQVRQIGDIVAGMKALEAFQEFRRSL